jgi:hypothetical protein
MCVSHSIFIYSHSVSLELSSQHQYKRLYVNNFLTKRKSEEERKRQQQLRPYSASHEAFEAARPGDDDELLERV